MNSLERRMARSPFHTLIAIEYLATLHHADVTTDEIEACGKLAKIRNMLDEADDLPDEGDERPETSLALTGAAIDLIMEATDGTSSAAHRRLMKAEAHLQRAMEITEPIAQMAALEAEVERLRLRVSGAAVPVENVVRIKAAAAALRDEVAALTIDAVEAPPEPDAPASLADLPVGTITVYAPFGMVRVRLPDGWDLAVGSFGDTYSVAPAPGMEPGPDEDVVRLGDGTVPDSWLMSHADVAEIARAWLAERAPQPVQEASAPVDPDDDGCPF